MRLIKQKPGQAAKYLADTIDKHLAAGHKTLWFLSGGSAINIAVEARKQLKSDTVNLTVTLIDERYGPDYHPDSNWRQLRDAGFDFDGLKAVPVLNGQSAEGTTKYFNDWLETAFKDNDYKIAMMGIGSDGHTAGILPGSPAFSTPGLATYYQWSDYQRITTTPAALAMLDEAIVSLSGDNKKPTLEQLQQDTPPEKMPAQLLKKLPQFIVFNDWIGEEI